MCNKNLTFIIMFGLLISNSLTCKKNSDNIISDYGEICIAEDFKTTAVEALAKKFGNHEVAEDYVWNDSEIIQIVLDNNLIIINGGGATINGNRVTITSAGTYSISGTLDNGQIVVDTEDVGIVRLILNGVNLNCSSSSPLFINKAKKTILVLNDSTQNYIKDGESYIFDNLEDDEPNAAIFSKNNLTICGEGALEVNGNYKNGISSKDGLVIKGGTIKVNSIDDGIRGKDYLIVRKGNISLNSGGDGLKSDNDTDNTKGYIYIENGIFDIKSNNDALQGETDVLINSCEMNITSGGGSSAIKNQNISAKGIKATINVIIDKGTFVFNTTDDALHSNSSLIINAGTFEISSGDDGIHSDSTLGINGGEIRIKKSYEGIESSVISITSGDIHLISSDDGLNVAGGNDGSGMNGWSVPITDSRNRLYMSGGHTVIESNGDGIDINGSVLITGGDLIMNGPTANDNGAIDYDGKFSISGGFILAAGSSGMAQAPGTSSTQYSILLNFNTAQQAGNLIHIENSEGEELFTFKPVKRYQSIAFSSSKLKKGFTYYVFTGGSSTGELIDNQYIGGKYAPGNQYTSFTVSSIVTKVGNSGFTSPGGL